VEQQQQRRVGGTTPWVWARVSPWPGGGGLNCTAWLRNACQLTKATAPSGENELGLPLQKIALFFGLSRYEHGRSLDPQTQQLPMCPLLCATSPPLPQ